jgi:predicted glycosyltransferase
MPTGDEAKIRDVIDQRPGFKLIRFDVALEELLEHADIIVSMGGYNTVCEILSHEKRALIVPRVVPRTEQLIRAVRLSELGLLDWLHPSNLSSERLGEWMSGVTKRLPERHKVIDLKGLSRILTLAVQMLRNRGATQFY